MKKLFTLALLAAQVALNAATITGNVRDINTTAADPYLQIWPTNTPLISGGAIIYTRTNRVNPTNGAFAFNLESGGYMVQVGANAKDRFPIGVPNSMATYHITNLIGVNLVFGSTNLTIANAFTAPGQVLTWDGTNVYRVSIGTHGQALAVNTNLPYKLQWTSVSGIGNYQPATDNLTNWSNISTSQLLTLQPGNANLTNWATIGTNIFASYTKLSDFQSYTNSTVDIPTNSLSAGQVLAWYPPNIIGTNITGGSSFDTNTLNNYLTTNKVGGAAFKSAATWQATNSYLTLYGEGRKAVLGGVSANEPGAIWLNQSSWYLQYCGETGEDIFTIARLNEITNAINTANSYTLTIGWYGTNYTWTQASNAQYQAANIATNQSQNASNSAIAQARADMTASNYVRGVAAGANITAITNNGVITLSSTASGGGGISTNQQIFYTNTYLCFFGNSISTPGQGGWSTAGEEWPRQLTNAFGLNGVTNWLWGTNASVAGARILTNDDVDASFVIPQRYTNLIQRFAPRLTGTNAFLFVQLGENDYQSMAIDTYMLRISNLWKQAKFDGFSVVAFSPSRRAKDYEDFTTAYTSRQICEKIKASIFDWDYCVPFDEMHTPSFLTEDGIIHLTWQGQRMLAGIVYNTISKPPHSLATFQERELYPSNLGIRFLPGYQQPASAYSSGNVMFWNSNGWLYLSYTNAAGNITNQLLNTVK